jgi:tetratricopeptide (TPR) repeat protein
VRALRGWTTDIAAGLASTARLLVQVLCSLDPDDRRGNILDANWKDILIRLGEGHPDAQAALAEPAQGLPVALDALERAGLVGVERSPELGPDCRAVWVGHWAEQSSPPSVDTMLDRFRTFYTIHPGVAETARTAADAAVLAAAEVELGDYFAAAAMHGLKDELEGGGRIVVDAARRAVPYLLRRERWGEASHLLNHMLARDDSPEALAYAMPLLRCIVEATKGLRDNGILATALALAGRVEEAEPLLRDLIARAAKQGDYRGAACACGELMNLLEARGRLLEALPLAEDKADYTRQAGLGPWTQLNDEGCRLQVLSALGRYDEVLESIQVLRQKMVTLQEQSEAEEVVAPWNVREVLLNIGRGAAVHSGRYEQALVLNAEIVNAKAKRGAGALELAQTRFNDYGPLLCLNRYDEARPLLQGCRSVLEAERDFANLGKVWSALAELEGETGSWDDAVRFEETAMRYKYQVGQPEDCAISHHNMAYHLGGQGADPATVLAHWLASAVIYYQTQPGGFATTLQELAGSELPPQPPTFDAVAKTVEQINGVRFRALFEGLPRIAPDGDAAIAVLWQRVAEERERRTAESERRLAVLDGMPPAIQAAFDLNRKGKGFATVLHAALAALPGDEAEARLRELRESGLISGGGDSEPVRRQILVLQNIERLLQAIAVVAQGAEEERAEVEGVLADLEQKDWSKLTGPVHRLWAGERDTEALTAGLDNMDSALLRCVLTLVRSSGKRKTRRKKKAKARKH